MIAAETGSHDPLLLSRGASLSSEPCSFAVLILSTLVGITSGCSNKPTRMAAPVINASSAAARAIAQYDTNRNGRIDGPELDLCPSIRSAVAQIDPSGEKGVTVETLARRIRAWQASRIGRMMVTCRVFCHADPVAGAIVTFFPEDFLGDNMPAATGRTDQSGTAMITVGVEGAKDAPGVPPGFYRVEIGNVSEDMTTKPDSERHFGLEIAADSPALTHGVRFDVGR